MNQLTVLKREESVSHNKRYRAYKTQWQREHRRKFQEEHGYSTTCNYGAGGIREEVLKRDNYCCVRCGMTDEQHKAKWGRPITVDHKNRNRKVNTTENLQTLCLTCHGQKDFRPHLVGAKAEVKRDQMLSLRKEGKTYQQIADAVGLSIGAAWKWLKRWESSANQTNQNN